jgi:hypothetical protein
MRDTYKRYNKTFYSRVEQRKGQHTKYPPRCNKTLHGRVYRCIAPTDPMETSCGTHQPVHLHRHPIDAYLKNNKIITLPH